MNEMILLEKLLVLEEKLLKPDIRTSPKELDLLLADDFFEFGTSGKVLQKKIVLEVVMV